MVHDASGGILAVNGMAIESLGSSQEELLAMNIRDVSPEATRPELHARWDQVLRGEPFAFEAQHERKDGSVIPLQITLGALNLPGGETFIAIVRDLARQRQHEEAYRQIIDAMHDTAFVIGFDGMFLEVNKRAVDALGYSRADLLKMGPVDIDPYLGPDDIAGLIVGMRTEPVQLFETEHRAKDGTIIPVEISSSPVSYLGEAAILSIARDITERKRAEEELRALTTRDEAMLRTIPDIIAELDANKKYAWLNDAGLRFFGDDVIGKDASFYFESQEDTHSQVNPLSAGDTDVYYVESWQRRRDGERRLLAWWCRSLRDREGAPAGVLSTARDITELRQAEMLTEARLRLLELATASTLEDFLSATLDELEELTDSRIGFCNFLGANEDTLAAAAWSTRTLAQYCEAQRDGLHLPVSGAGVWADCIRQRRPVIHNDYAALSTRRGTPPGHGAIIRVLSVPVFRGDKIVAVMAVGNKPRNYSESDIHAVSNLADLAWDIAAGKKAEEALRTSEEQLRQSQKMDSVGRLAGGIAHDFNNMLGVILGHAELAMDQLDPGQPEFENLQEIHKAASRSAGITQQLLAFARRQVTVPTVLDVNRSVEGMLDMLRRLIGEDVELVWLPGRDLGTIEVDPSQFDQVLVNILANARDAIVGEGKVIIETRVVFLDEAFCREHEGCAVGDYVLLAASDNGSGMDDKALEHIFEPFFTTKEIGKGTGLGMATVYGIVKQNHGCIDVDTELGRGTTVKVYLPRRVEAAAEYEQTAVVQPSQRGSETLLVVEDETSILSLVERILKGLDYTVLTAKTPAEAVRTAEAHPGEITLLITDVIMPEMNGWQLAERLRASRPQLKTLYMSGYAAEVISGRGVLEDGVGFLQKPFSPGDLAASVRASLDQGGDGPRDFRAA